jgi:hypothetical protein
VQSETNPLTNPYPLENAILKRLIAEPKELIGIVRVEKRIRK